MPLIPDIRAPGDQSKSSNTVLYVQWNGISPPPPQRKRCILSSLNKFVGNEFELCS